MGVVNKVLVWGVASNERLETGQPAYQPERFLRLCPGIMGPLQQQQKDARPLQLPAGKLHYTLT